MKYWLVTTQQVDGRNNITTRTDTVVGEGTLTDSYICVCEKYGFGILLFGIEITKEDSDKYTNYLETIKK